MLSPVYEYVQSALKAFQPTNNAMLFELFNLRPPLLAVHKREARPAEQEKLPVCTDSVQRSVRSQKAVIDSVVVFFQERITHFCQSHGLHPVNLSVCLCEALANAIIHGNLEVPSALKEACWEEFEALIRERESLPEFAERQVTIRCDMTLEALRLEITDQGRGFDVAKFRRAQLEQHAAAEHEHNPDISGRGLRIITALMDAVFWNDTGNRITLIKSLQRA